MILLPEADSKGRSKSSWFGSKKKTSSGGGLFGGSSRRKSKYGTLKKAAVIGASVYGGYQLGKLTSRFGHYGGGYRYGFNDWNRWREVDGFMCRDNNDCNWIDDRLYCQDYELDFEPSVRMIQSVVCPPDLALCSLCHRRCGSVATTSGSLASAPARSASSGTTTSWSASGASCRCSPSWRTH